VKTVIKRCPAGLKICMSNLTVEPYMWDVLWAVGRGSCCLCERMAVHICLVCSVQCSAYIFAV
jgi:hypothetical protein